MLKTILTLAVLSMLHLSPNVQAEEIVGALSQKLSSTGDTKNSNITGGAGTTFELTAGQKDKRASLKWTMDNIDSNLAVEFSVPTGSSDNTVLANLDGLAKFNKVTVNYKSALTSLDITKMLEICNEVGIAITSGCDLEGLKAQSKGKNAQKISDLIKEAWNDAPPKFWGTSLSYGSNKMSYIATDSTTKQSETKYGWAASIYYGGFFKSKYKSMWAIEAKREESYKDGDNGIICPPQELNLPISCVSGPLGKPTRNIKDIISFHYRQKFDKFSISPSVNFDNRSDTLGIDVPIFLFKDAGNDFVGGINLGWTNEEHETTLGIFIGKKFSFY
ncbi:hypothetical protein [Rheinheimera hassiensis]|uniref:hypothetical protein n=1 Tax=Rheinheimera hassiensis TaxID=1193627 RepID=UPI001F06A8E0|nr:hypothetical protein [Rheinheimera hassiensis]